MIDGRQLRKTTLAARNAQSPEELTTRSAAICKRLLSLPEISESQSIFAYVSFRSEVITTTLIDTLLAAGKSVSVPVTRLSPPKLDAIRITDRTKDLVPGYCDIPEPREELWQTHAVSPESIDAILLPGSVFDLRCGRFGYGGGFYDRFVSSVPSAVRIGLAFELQIVERAPLQDHDELLDMVVTESRVIRAMR